MLALWLSLGVPMKWSYLLIVFCLSCATLSDAGEEVKLVKKDLLVNQADCKEVGKFTFETKLGFGAGRPSIVVAGIRNHAAKLGANVVTTSYEFKAGEDLHRSAKNLIPIGTQLPSTAFKCSDEVFQGLDNFI